jgi:hypothetical protein
LRLTPEQEAKLAEIRKRHPIDKAKILSTPPDPSEGGPRTFLGQLETRMKEELARLDVEKKE